MIELRRGFCTDWQLDDRFQDWLASPGVGLLQRESPLLRNQLPHMLSKGNGRLHQFVEILLERYGNIVSDKEIAKKLYNGYAGRSELYCVKETASRVKYSLLNPDLLFQKRRAGRALGVKQLLPSNIELSALYMLWKAKEQGSFLNGNVKTKRLVDTIGHFRSYLEDTHFRIEYLEAKENQGGYFLLEI